MSRCRAAETSLPYPSQEAAVKAAFTACLERSTLLEYAGGVYQDHGQFYYSVPFSDGSQYEVRSFKIAIPRSARLVALYHTHPRSYLPGDNSEEISDADIHTATNMAVPSYVGILKTHRIVVYIPHVSPLVFKQDGAIHISYGQIVGELVL